jgi:thiamine kinase-like enzyme
MSDPDPELRRIVATLPPFSGRTLDDLRLRRLPGLTNRTFKVTLAGQHFVLRLPGSGTECYIDRRAEAHNTAIAAGLGLCAPLLYHDHDSGIQLSRYIEHGKALDREALRDPGALRAVTRLLQRLHHSGRRFLGRMCLFAKLDQYLALAARGDDDLRRRLRHLRETCEPLRSRLEHGPQVLKPCHIDPAPANFFRATTTTGQPRYYLLDWEYSAMCEPFWDLADLAAEAEFGRDREMALLECYYGEVGAAVYTRFRLYRAMLDLLAAAWAAARLAGRDDDTDTEPDSDLRIYAGVRIERVQTMLSNR